MPEQPEAPSTKAHGTAPAPRHFDQGSGFQASRTMTGAARLNVSTAVRYREQQLRVTFSNFVPSPYTAWRRLTSAQPPVSGRLKL